MTPGHCFACAARRAPRRARASPAPTSATSRSEKYEDDSAPGLVWFSDRFLRESPRPGAHRLMGHFRRCREPARRLYGFSRRFRDRRDEQTQESIAPMRRCHARRHASRPLLRRADTRSVLRHRARAIGGPPGRDRFFRLVKERESLIVPNPREYGQRALRYCVLRDRRFATVWDSLG